MAGDKDLLATLFVVPRISDAAVDHDVLELIPSLVRVLEAFELLIRHASRVVFRDSDL